MIVRHTPLFSALAIALAGAGVFHAVDAPLPFLLGPMFACLIAALLRAPMRGAGQVGVLFRTILGVAVGAAITPELAHRLPEMAYSVALVPVFIAVIGLAGYPYFRRLCRFDHPTAYYAAMPGGLQDMLVFGQEAGANVRALSLVHATRVLVIVTLIPFLLRLVWGLPLDHPTGEPALETPIPDALIMAACAVIGWKGGERLGLFGASIIGPLILAAIASMSGLITHRPPAEAILAAQYFIGLGVGVQYVGVTVAEIRRVVLAALGYCVILAGLSVVFAVGVAALGLAPEVEALLAFAPGGQAEMVVLAIVAGVDMAYVVTHHLVRLIVVILGAPLAARVLRG